MDHSQTHPERRRKRVAIGAPGALYRPQQPTIRSETRMAGHSKWANIQHRKGRQDAARSKLFSKLSKEITVAAKMGDPDPEKNPRLRLAVKEAKASSVPKDVIERAIRKSQGGDADSYEEIRYEGYGPGGVAILVEAMTDNPTAPRRTCARPSASTAGTWARPAPWLS